MLTNIDCDNIIRSNSIITEMKSFTTILCVTRDRFLVKQIRSKLSSELSLHGPETVNLSSIDCSAPILYRQIRVTLSRVTLSGVVFARLNILMKLNFEMIPGVDSQLCLFMTLNLRVFAFPYTYHAKWTTILQFPVHFLFYSQQTI